MKKIFVLLSLLLFITSVYSQSESEKKKIISETNIDILLNLAEKYGKRFKKDKALALKLAKQNGWIIKGERNGRRIELMRVSKDSLPIYYITHNINAARSTRANCLHSGGILGLNLEGQGMEAHIWDEGIALQTHQEYDGAGGDDRYSVGDGAYILSSHSAHVTGTVIASGYIAEAKGMAPQAFAFGYDWSDDLSEVTTAASGGMLLSNHSYGFSYPDDQIFGAYGPDAVDCDDIMYNAPYYLMISSAGNDGEDNTLNGVPLEGNPNYDKLSFYSISKNSLIVANGQDAYIDAAGNYISEDINPSSSQGPTDDYRIKPDITGNGTGLYSTYESADDAYSSISGTSMASPNVMGTLLLLQQHYNNINSIFMSAATLKGLALHTADDAGPTGPDAVFGWGLLNAKKAAETITDNGEETIISELIMDHGLIHTFNVTSDGINELIVSISWTDPPGTANPDTNSITPALVNDLDVRLIQDANTWYPYRLTSVSTNGTGDNIVDPFEKIIVENASGSYTVQVTHKGTLIPSQYYTLIITGLAAGPSTPVADFVADDLSPIVSNQRVTFFDISDNLPTSWTWSFNPSTVSYVYGSNANSQNPQVTFDASGLYSVTLTAANTEGNDTEVKTDYINVSSSCTPCYSWGHTDFNTSITRVIFNTIDNTSTKPVDTNGNAYTDYTAITTDVTALNSYDLTTQINTDGDYTLTTRVWIDWNQNCDFNDPGETYELGSTTNVPDGATSNSPLSVTVPANALGGNTIMRVSTVWEPDGPVFPCDLSFDGEVEDYTLNVTALPLPSISDVTPNSGLVFKDGGKNITINGTDLGGAAVTVGGVKANIISNTVDQIDIELGGGNYTGSDVVVTTGFSDFYPVSFTYNTRNTIPAGGGTDGHSKIQWALDGLHGWWGSTVFDAAKTIEVYGDTYNEGISLNAELSPTSENNLIIRNKAGESPIIDASSFTYGIDLSTVDYVQLNGFTVHSADQDNIFAQGNNVLIQYNKTFGSVNGSGIKIETGTPFTVQNNLSYNNLYGIHLNSPACIIKNNTAYGNGHLITEATDQEIFYEDWEDNDTDGWTIEETYWALQTSEAVGTYGLRSSRSSNGGYITKDDAVDISGHRNIRLQFQYRQRVDMNGAAPDELRAEYNSDASGWNSFFSVIQAPDIFTAYTESVADGTNLEIRFFALSNTLGDRYIIDEIKIIGNPLVQSGAGLYIESGTGSSVENNIFVARSGDDSYYALKSEIGATVNSDFNTYYTTNTNLFDYNGTAGNTGPMQTNDLTSNPDFVSDGTDFHLKSTFDSYVGGSWPPTFASDGTWTTDASDSPAIDAGNPADPYSNEPQAGGRINQGAYGNTSQASKSAVIDFTWNGTLNTDWQTPANWTPANIPSPGDNINVPNVTNDPIIDDDDLPAVCNNLLIGPDASVTIAANGQMTVFGDITNNADVDGLIVKSNATGDGSLIINNSGVNATVERYLSHTNGEPGQWHYLGSSVLNTPVSLFNTNNFYEYNEFEDDWWTGATYFWNGSSGWNVPSGNLTLGKGYIYYYFEHTLNYQGVLNHDDAGYDLPVLYTEHPGNAGNGEPYTNFDGWNLLSNPHPCTIDWELINRTDLTNTVYIYDDGISNYTYYQDGGLSLNGGTKYIPSGQGFFVKSNDNIDGGILTIPNESKVHYDNIIMKAYDSNENLLKLRMDHSGYFDETVVMLKENAANTFDDQFDAYKRFSQNDDVVQIYTFIPGISINYAVNCINKNDLVIIPLAYKVNVSDVFSILSDEFNFDDYDVYLHDIEEYIFTELSSGKTYSFYSEAGTYTDRFELVFRRSALSVSDDPESSVLLYPNPNRGSFNLEVRNNSNDFTVEITNVTGRIVYKNTFENKITNEIKMTSQSTGVYFVKIRFDNNSVINRKIIVE